MTFYQICGYENYNNKEIKFNHKHEAKEAAADEGRDEDARVLLVTVAHNILSSFFSNVEMYIRHQKKVQLKLTLLAQVLLF